MKEMFRYALILGLIGLIASAVLAVVNAFTEPQIRLQQAREEQAALEELMPGASVFNPVPEQGDLKYYRAYNEQKKLLGFVIKASQRGYSSDITVLAALSPKLEIADIKILSANETPGLGSRINEDSFRGQFRGKDIQSLDSVQAITGATISSSAVLNAIRNKITLLKEELLIEAANAK